MSNPAEPEVVLDVEHRDGVFLLVLANTGGSTAFEPRVTFDRPLRGLHDRADVAALPIWTGLAMLRPGIQVDVLLDPAGAARPEDQQQFRATVTYADGTGHRHERAFAHDLSAYADLPTPLT
jgi:hypothetical protein